MKEQKSEQTNQLNLTVVALVALVAIVGLVALVMNAAAIVKAPVATGSQLASAQSSDKLSQEVAATDAANLAGSAFAKPCKVENIYPDNAGITGAGCYTRKYNCASGTLSREIC